MGKYDPLYEHLRQQRLRRVRMSFAQIEKIIGAPLPTSAHQHRAWWANETVGTHSHAAVWMKAGFVVRSVDQSAEEVLF